MVTRNSPAAMGYSGFPALIFFEITNYGRGTQTHEELMRILKKIYAYERAYLPITFERHMEELTTKKYIGSTTEKLSLWDMVIEANGMIQQMHQKYKPEFEGIVKCSQEEKDFCRVMDGVFERLTEIAAISKVIDSQKLEPLETIG